MNDFLIISPVPFFGPRNRIDDLVKATGRAAYQIAKEAGISAAALCRYRKGLRAPTALHALRLATALGVSVEDLITA